MESIISDGEIKRRLQELADDQAAVSELVAKMRSFVSKVEAKHQEFESKRLDADKMLHQSVELLQKVRYRLEGFVQAETMRQAEVKQFQSDQEAKLRSLYDATESLQTQLDEQLEALSDQFGELQNSLTKSLEEQQIAERGRVQFFIDTTKSNVRSLVQQFEALSSKLNRRTKKFRREQQAQVDQVIAGYESQRSAYQSLVIQLQAHQVKAEELESAFTARDTEFRAQLKEQKEWLESESRSRLQAVDSMLSQDKATYKEHLEKHHRPPVFHWFVTLLTLAMVIVAFTQIWDSKKASFGNRPVGRDIQSMAPEAESGLRVSADHKVRIPRAYLVAADAESARLQAADGKVYKVPSSNLSDQDQQITRDALRSSNRVALISGARTIAEDER